MNSPGYHNGYSAGYAAGRKAKTVLSSEQKKRIAFEFLVAERDKLIAQREKLDLEIEDLQTRQRLAALGFVFVTPKKLKKEPADEKTETLDP